MSIITVDNHEIELSNEDKILFPKTKITKGDLINYYWSIAPIMLTHVREHPIAMQRFPDGITHEGFYQKNKDDYFPRWIDSVAIKRKSDAHAVYYVVCNNSATLVYLANQAVITMHLLLGTVGKLRYPDRLVFDLDPVQVPLSVLVDTAHQIKKLVEKYGLTPFVMTTGSKGLHVTVPLKQKNTFKQVRMFAQKIAREVIEKNPNQVTLEIRKEKRIGKVFIDILRNQPVQHAVAPYSVRPIEGAPVAMPLAWSEIAHLKNFAQTFTIGNVATHLKKHGDAWRNFDSAAAVLKV